MSDQLRDRQKNPYLAQMLFRRLGQQHQTCQAVRHEQSALAAWEVRFYQNPERALDFSAQGMASGISDQAIWDEACREQDSIGVRVHDRMFACGECALRMMSLGGGEAATFAEMMDAALATGDAILLVSDRRTEEAVCIGNIPGAIQERDILPLLREQSDALSRFLKSGE